MYYIYMHTYIHAYIYVYVYVCVCVCVCVCIICMYVYIYTYQNHEVIAREDGMGGLVRTKLVCIYTYIHIDARQPTR